MIPYCLVFGQNPFGVLSFSKTNTSFYSLFFGTGHRRTQQVLAGFPRSADALQLVGASTGSTIDRMANGYQNPLPNQVLQMEPGKHKKVFLMTDLI